MPNNNFQWINGQVPGFRDPPKKVRDQRETDVENYGCDITERKGGEAYKFKSPGRAGVQDRIHLYPVPPEHREIIARYVRFVEYKRPKGKKAKKGVLSIQQIREKELLLELGHCVLTIDTKADCDKLL